MAEALDDLGRGIAEGMTPAGGLMDGLGGLLDMLFAPQKAAPPLNQRLPRIVPQGKDLIDLNTNKPVGRVGSTESQDSGMMALVKGLHKALGIEGWSTEAGASQNLAMGGSLMANYSPPTPGSEFLRNNPLLKTVLDMTSSFKPSPLDAAGASQAMLGPIGRVTPNMFGDAGAAKRINEAQKHIVKALFRADPEILKDVVNSQQMLHVGVPGAAGGLNSPQSKDLINEVMQGAFAHFQPGGLSGTLRVHPAVMKGKHPGSLSWPKAGLEGKILKNQGVEGLPDMAAHEATHFLNEPTIANLGDGYGSVFGGPAANLDLQRFASALEPFIGQAKYGKRIVQQHLRANDPLLAVNEGLSYLSQPTGRNAASTWLHNAMTNKERGLPFHAFDQNTQGLLQEALSAATRIPGIVRNNVDDILEGVNWPKIVGGGE